MVRMIISLPESDKKWLEQTGRRHRISSAEVVRRAVARMRNSAPGDDLHDAIMASAGRWKKSARDSQDVVDAMRSEWERSH